MARITDFCATAYALNAFNGNSCGKSSFQRLKIQILLFFEQIVFSRLVFAYLSA